MSASPEPNASATTSDPGNPWPFVAPLIALLVIGSRVPWPEHEPGERMAAQETNWLVGMLALEALVVACLLGLWWSINRKRFPFAVSPAAIAIGIVGTVLWVLLARFDAWIVQLAGLGWLVPDRPGFNPFTEIESPAARGLFLGTRFLLLAGLVPLAEELFLRGWLARWIDSPDRWHLLSFKSIGRNGLLAVAAYAVLQHPMEAVAALAWFNLVSWWMLRTGRFWDCVAIHAATNLTLGLWILYSGEWRLW